MIQNYRKRPVTIQAVLWDGSQEAYDEISAWSNGAVKEFSSAGILAIDTLEGTMLAQKGDYIILGVAGEFYPCKPDIFAATYEPA